MTKIVMKADYLNSLAQQIEQVTAQLRQVDGMLQHALQGAAWQSSNRQTIIGLYQTHQQRFRSAGQSMQELAAYVKTTREKMQQEDQTGGPFGLTGINPLAPFDGPGSTVGTLTSAVAVARLGLRVKNGYMVKAQLDRNTPRVLVRESHEAVKGNKAPSAPRKLQLNYVLFRGVFGMVCSLSFIVVIQKFAYGTLGLTTPWYAIGSFVVYAFALIQYVRFRLQKLKQPPQRNKADNSSGMPIATLTAITGGAYLLANISLAFVTQQTVAVVLMCVYIMLSFVVFHFVMDLHRYYWLSRVRNKTEV